MRRLDPEPYEGLIQNLKWPLGATNDMILHVNPKGTLVSRSKTIAYPVVEMVAYIVCTCLHRKPMFIAFVEHS